MNPPRYKSGFSLIELLVVVAIIGVLAAIGTVGYGNYITQTRIKVNAANLDNMAQAIQTKIATVAAGLDPITYANCSAFLDGIATSENPSAKNVYNNSSTEGVFVNGNKLTPSASGVVTFKPGQILMYCTSPCETNLQNSGVVVCSCELDSVTGVCTTDGSSPSSDCPDPITFGVALPSCS